MSGGSCGCRGTGGSDGVLRGGGRSGGGRRCVCVGVDSSDGNQVSNKPPWPPSSSYKLSAVELNLNLSV